MQAITAQPPILMPIYMDLHIVPGITAQAVAEAHVLDLKIQEQYQCNCITYWVVEPDNSAFCLIEAPNADAVRKLHSDAHGLLPNQIIEVNRSVVESFLGRVMDPETPDIPTGQLKVFNDSAVRTLVLIKTTDPVILANTAGGNLMNELFTAYRAAVVRYSRQFGGDIAEHREDIDTIISFASRTDAVDCASDLLSAFTESERSALGLRISVNSGVPVSTSNRIFGDTIDFGRRLLYLAGDGKVVVASAVGELVQKSAPGQKRDNVTTASASNEKLLDHMMTVLEAHHSKEAFSVEEFCRLMALSKSSLNRATQSLTGMAPAALLKVYRLDRSLYLLRKNHGNIAEAAYASGFNSTSYFSKCFREHFGMMPSAYVGQLG